VPDYSWLKPTPRLGLGLLTLLGVTVFFVKAAQPAPYDVLSHCINHESISYHVHPTLSIVVDGIAQAVPANIGITATCMHPIHTHAADGVLHLESPQPRDFKLKEFFLVWGQVFNKNQILGYVRGQNDELTLTVDGSLSNDWENLILKDKQKIIISYSSK
jgi:hypothetical protein